MRLPGAAKESAVRDHIQSKREKMAAELKAVKAGSGERSREETERSGERK